MPPPPVQIGLKVTKIVFLIETKSLKIVQPRQRDFAFILRTPFFQGFELANTDYCTPIYSKNISYLQYFAVLLDNNIVVAIK